MKRAKLNSSIQVLVVDDNYDHAAGIRGIASLDGGFDVVGIATNADVCLGMVKKYKPDVILMDINMPDVDGITLIQKIKKIDSESRIIAVTGYDDSDLIYRVMKEGAKGYILKTMASSQLIQGVIEVANGKIFMPSIIVSKFFEHFQTVVNEDSCPLSNEENLLNYLTQREEEVLDLLTQGITYKGVANQLFISETTVKTHVNNIFQKLQVNDRTQAVLYAINNGLVKKMRTNKIRLAV
ncbi:MAG: response regulator transcription factor [Candidatus Gastranaerophilales bacterium]|nr:response regulator transcription factor [Candidatus Gastranaerophilales bacterium]